MLTRLLGIATVYQLRPKSAEVDQSLAKQINHTGMMLAAVAGIATVMRIMERDEITASCVVGTAAMVMQIALTDEVGITATVMSIMVTNAAAISATAMQVILTSAVVITAMVT